MVLESVIILGNEKVNVILMSLLLDYCIKSFMLFDCMINKFKLKIKLLFDSL